MRGTIGKDRYARMIGQIGARVVSVDGEALIAKMIAAGSGGWSVSAALEQQDIAACLGENRGDDRARRAGSDDYDIEILHHVPPSGR